MTRIRLDPVAMRDSGLRYVTAADGATQAATAIVGIALPAMPAAMSARYQAELPAIAARLRVVADAETRLAEELQLRAAAAEAADAPASGTEDAAGKRLADVVEQGVTAAAVVAPGGGMSRALITVGKGGATVQSASGLRFTMPELAPRAEPVAKSAGDPGYALPDTTTSGEPGRTAPAAQPARAPVALTAIGGPVAAEVHTAATMTAGEPAPGAERYLSDDPIDPADVHGGDLRAAEHDGTGAPAPHEMPGPEATDRQDWACWMAGVAAQEGLPPTLPVMMALAYGGMRNMPAHEEGVGFFELNAGGVYAPAGHGLPRDARPDAQWWADNPDAQLDHVLRQLKDSSGGVRAAELDDAAAIGRWAAEAQPGLDASAYAQAHDAAAQMVSRCRHGETAMPSGSHRALAVAARELGVRELGANAGPQVERYLAAADTPSGNPWCASFVTWSLDQTGHDFHGSQWAAVSSWVHAAQAGEHGLQLVDAAHARPGDIVAYDWGGGSDFGSDGHIGFLESHVGQDGRFTAIEGNAQDAVSRIQRSTGLGNVVFIRASG